MISLPFPHPLLLKQVLSTHSLEFPCFYEVFPPIPSWPYTELESEQTLELSELEKFGEMTYKLSWMNLVSEDPACAPIANLSMSAIQNRSRLSQTAPWLPVLFCCILFWMNVWKNLKIRSLKLRNLHFIGRMSSFLSLLFSFAVHSRYQGLENQLSFK